MSDERDTDEYPDLQARGFVLENLDDDGAADGVGFFFQDFRTFADLLLDWQIHVGLMEPVAFIRSIGLDGCLSEEDFTRLVTDQAAPDYWLARYFTHSFPQEVASKTKVKNRIAEAEIDHPYSKVKITEKIFQERSVFIPTDSQDDVPIESTSALQNSEAEAHKLVDILKVKFAQLTPLSENEGAQVSEADMIRNFAEACGLDPWVIEGLAPLPAFVDAKEAARNIASLLAADDPHEYDMTYNAALYQFCHVQTLDLERALREGTPKSFGGIIRLLRLDLQINLHELGRRVLERSSRSDHVGEWERDGRFPIDGNTLRKLAMVLGLEGDAITLFEEKRWEQHDRTWSAILESADTFGTLLCAYRNLAHLSQSALAEKIGVFKNSIQRWENNTQITDFESDRTALNERTLQKIFDVLNIPPLGQERIMQARWRQHDQEWHDCLAEADTFGKRFKAHRNLAHITLKDFAEQVDVSIATVLRWQRDDRLLSIDASVLAKIVDALHLDPMGQQHMAALLEQQQAARRMKGRQFSSAVRHKMDHEWSEKLKVADTFGDCLQAYRNLAHLSREELAESLGVSDTTVGRWEVNTRLSSINDGVLTEMANVLGLEKNQVSHLSSLIEKQRGMSR
ncbi:MAG: transcriptional regulator [Alphaproteobacteria bacterium]|nr:transcriptional regulator [Alphaproteobacteria bacterium]